MTTTRKPYQTGYGILRIIACFTVIFHHFLAANQTYIDTLATSQWYVVLDNVLMCNNTLFFMLSGKFALENYHGDLLPYYKNKVVKILLPFLAMSLFYYCFFVLDSITDFRLVPFLKALSGDKILGYLWFVYALIGFYLVVPFLSAMLRALREVELWYLTLLLLGMLGAKVILAIYGIHFVLRDFPFYGISLCMLGYLADRLIRGTKKETITLVVCGLCALISCWEAYALAGIHPYLYDYSVAHVLMCIGIYMAISRHVQLPGAIAGKVCKWVADGTYYIYLLHILGQSFFFGTCWSLWVLLVKLPFVLALFAGSIVIFLVTLVLAKIVQLFTHTIAIGITRFISRASSDT